MKGKIINMDPYNVPAPINIGKNSGGLRSLEDQTDLSIQL
jgi:hypothetical protein